MLKFLESIKKENKDKESLRTISEIENFINDKRYGLVWEKHSEKVNEMLKDHIPVFIEDEERKIVADKNKDYNFLLEGDSDLKTIFGKEMFKRELLRLIVELKNSGISKCVNLAKTLSS